MTRSRLCLFDEIEALIGTGPALKLFSARGGGRIRIPAVAPDDHWLVGLVGREAADALCSHWRQDVASGSASGIEIDLPRGPTGALASARRAMAALLAQGLTADEAARASGLTRRTAYRMRKRPQKRDPGQGTLF